MSLSPIAFFGLLDETNPKGTDSRTISDDQHRNILASMKQQAPNWTAAVTATHGDVNLLAGYVAAGKKPLPGVGGATILWFYANTVPPGYTIEAVDANLRNLSIAPGGAVPVGGGTIDGADDPSALNYTKDVTPVGTNSTENLEHVHEVSGNTGGPSAPFFSAVAGANAASDTHVHGILFDSQGMSANTTHTHTFTGVANSVNVAFNPRRAMGVMGKLDA